MQIQGTMTGSGIEGQGARGEVLWRDRHLPATRARHEKRARAKSLESVAGVPLRATITFRPLVAGQSSGYACIMLGMRGTTGRAFLAGVIVLLVIFPAATVAGASPYRGAVNRAATEVPSTSFVWSPVKRIDPHGSTAAISCASSQFCMVVDTFGGVVTWDGSAWSSVKAVNPNGGLSSVSCASATFCVAGDANGDIFAWHGKSWSDRGQADRFGAGIDVLSCPVLDFCGAGDGDGYAYTLTAKGPTAPFAVSPDPGTGSIASISCLTKAYCVAVAGGGNASSWNGKQWSQPVAADLTSMTCVSARFCVALTLDAALKVWNAGRWSAPVTLNPVDPSSGPKTVSCASASFCAAVGQDSSLWDGQSWSSPTPVGDFEGVSAVSCPGNGLCVAIDQDGNATVGRFA